MQKNNKKNNEKGITLVVLVITIVILGLISIPTAINISNIIKVNDISLFKDDLNILSETVSQVYAQTDSISDIGPIYNGSMQNIPINPNDNNTYYIINAHELNNKIYAKTGTYMLSLSYGTGNYEIQPGSTPSSNDIYIINEQSRTIYYVKGFENSNGETIYSYPQNYTNIEVASYVAPGLPWGDQAISAINSHSGLQEVEYKPAVTSTQVVIPSDKNGGATEQTFTQANLGTQSLKWYVLSADENGVNLVSQPTRTTVEFKDAGGYDNGLYYLNEISTKLFANESGYGVDSSRVHALNLSDIKKAAEGMNGSSYNWDTEMVQASREDTYNDGQVGTKTYTYTPSNTKFPQIYGTEGNVAKSTNNPMYDEEVPSNYEPISGDLINSTSKTASTLTVNQTYLYSGNNETTKTRLGDFGSSGIGGELFNSSGTNYWLASRCVYAFSNDAEFDLRRVYSGYLGSGRLCASDGNRSNPSHACRVVVSIPGSRVNVANDGTVSLK
ncbi:MAG: hypothetical protein IKG14_03445 [Clostridia bacterium]|nr:hypothetical protein [Clostridia bacterium]